MNSKLLAALLPAATLLAISCQRPLIVDDDPTNNDANWELLDYQSERQVQSLHATPFELFVISENQFSRFDANHELLEKRPLDVAFGVKGIPALSDNAFTRLTLNQQGRQVIEFHLTRNPAGIKKILVDSLTAPAGEFLEIEESFGRKIGAFSADGTLFLMPARVLPSRYYALLLFQVSFNAAHNSFTSVNVIKRIDLQDLNAADTGINNVRFLNGIFYVTSKEGAWRVTPSGEAAKIFPQWMLDVFSWQGDNYITGLNEFDLHESTDNGVTWERLNQNSELKMVETADTLIFTQTVLGASYRLMPEDLKKAKKIAWPVGITEDAIIFYGVVFYENRYYFALDREIYFTDEVITE